MAESKLTDQPVLTTPADGDLAYLVDISDTSGGALGTSKKITVANLMTKAPVVSVNGEVGAVSLDSTEIKRVGTTGDSIDQDLTAAENSINEIKAILKYPSATVTGLQVNATNKLELDSTNQKAVFTINGSTAATIGPSQSLFPALKVGPTGNDYILPVARGVTGNVAVYDDATHTSEWRSLATGNLSGTSDGITQGTTNLFLTSAERTKLTSVMSGAAVALVSGTAPIVSSGGTSPAISITAATTSAAGSMSAADKSKLDGIQAGAEVNVNADWNATSGDAQILNKPTFVASVAGTSPIVSTGTTTPTISITAATTSTAGSMSAADKLKLDGIASGAEVNQNAYSNFVVGATTISANSETDTLTLIAGANITLTPNAGAESITIAATGSTGVSSVSGTAPIVSIGGANPVISITAATTLAAGSMSSADKSKLDGIEAGAQVNQNAFSNFAVATQTTVAADTVTDTVTFAVAGGMTITTNGITDTITFDSANLDNDDVTLQAPRLIDLNGESLSIFDLTGNVAVFNSDTSRLWNLEVTSQDAGNGSTIKLYEASNNGANYVTLAVNSNLASNVTFTLPTSNGTNGYVLQTDGSGNTSWVAQSGGGGSSYSVVRTQSGTSYTLVLGDAGDYIQTTSTTAVTITVPPQSSVTWAADTEIYFEQNNTGQITIAAGSGVTINSSETLKSFARYSVIALKRVASDVWTLTGERALV